MKKVYHKASPVGYPPKGPHPLGPAAPSARNRLGLRVGDGVLAGGVLALSGLLLAALFAAASPGQTAVVQFPGGEERLSLEREGVYRFEGKTGEVVLRVEEGRVRFLHSDCPDQVCVRAGWLSRTGQTAACVPAGVLVRIEGAREDGAVDIVAG